MRKTEAISGLSERQNLTQRFAHTDYDTAQKLNGRTHSRGGGAQEEVVSPEPGNKARVSGQRP